MQVFKGKKRILLAVAIGTFMSALDSSVVNIVLPRISTYFHAPLSTIEWIVMSYLLVVSSLLLAYGRLGDMYGHKRIYIWGFLIFTVGSFLCGLSGTVFMLIIFRAVQAIGAGMLMAMGPAIVTDNVESQERGKALSVTAVAVASALTIGPVLGGALTVLLGWKSIFFVNIPIGIIGVWLAQRSIPDRGERTVQSFDFSGAVLVFLALISILLPLSLVEHYGWENPVILSLIAFGLLLTIIFVIWEKRLKNPMFDLSLFENRLFSMSNLSTLLNFMGQFTIILLMPYYLQQLRGLTPEKAGLIYLAMPLVTMIIAPISGSLSDRMDSRYISASGMAFMALGMGLLSSLKANSPYSFLVAALAVVGFGIGLFQTPNNSAIMGAVPPTKRGIASGMQATMRNIGMVLGVAISGALFTSSHDALMKSGIAHGLQGAALKSASFVGALHITYIVAAVFAAAGIITSLIKGSTLSNE
ncbi:MAG TPA: MFS transporter [Bacillota bacterium]|nr:MFS transporter [Bacillota bacterium]